MFFDVLKPSETKVKKWEEIFELLREKQWCVPLVSEYARFIPLVKMTGINRNHLEKL